MNESLKNVADGANNVLNGDETRRSDLYRPCQVGLSGLGWPGVLTGRARLDCAFVLVGRPFFFLFLYIKMLRVQLFSHSLSTKSFAHKRIVLLQFVQHITEMLILMAFTT